MRHGITRKGLQTGAVGIKSEFTVAKRDCTCGLIPVDVVAREGKSNILLSGGSTAATRGLTLLHSLGFRKFKLFGYDSCYWGKPDEVHGFNKRKQAFQVEMMGRKFWTDAELMAQAQDFDKMLKQPEALGLDVEVYGDGMIPHIWNTRKLMPSFEDIYV